jgi:arginase
VASQTQKPSPAGAENPVTSAMTRREKAISKRRTNSVVLIYAPLHLGGSHKGVSMGPAAMRVAEVSEKIQRLGFQVEREIDIPVPPSVCFSDRATNAARCVPEILEVSQAVGAAVEQALADGAIPITIGGDHSLAIGSIAGVANHFRKLQKNFGLIWFDAHGDINTPDTTLSGNVHGMPLAVSLGHGDKRLTELFGFSPKVAPNRAALVGIRDLDDGERDMIDRSGITPFTMSDIDHLGLGKVTDLAMAAVGADLSGIHVSFDIDVIDPEVAPGVSVPAAGGFNYRESHFALELLAQSDLMCSLDIVELNPARDLRNKTAKLATQLILSALGKRIL